MAAVPPPFFPISSRDGGGSGIVVDKGKGGLGMSPESSLDVTLRMGFATTDSSCLLRDAEEASTLVSNQRVPAPKAGSPPPSSGLKHLTHSALPTP